MEKIFIILCDTLRAKSLPHYGNERNTIPNLLPIIDKDFVVYNRAYAPSPWTIPSHLSFFTGLYPSEVMETPTSLQLNPNFKTLPLLFKDSGYKTFGLSTNELVSSLFGFDAGFDVFLQLWLPNPEEEEILLNLQGNNYFRKALTLFRLMVAERDKVNFSKGIKQKIFKKFRNTYKDSTPFTDKAIKLLTQQISENKDQKLFCFVNLMQTHEKYNPPPSTRNRFARYNPEHENYYKKKMQFDHYAVEPFSGEFLEYLKLRYEEEILYLDVAISDFIQFLKGNALYDDSTIIITSDHGEHFGEKGHFAHLFSVYEPVIKIPLYIKWPGKVLGREKVNTNLVMLNDLFSTFIAILNSWYPLPDSSIDINGVQKREWIVSQWPDLSSHIDGCRKKRQTFSIEDIGLKEGGLTAYVFSDATKIIENGNEFSCYDLQDDFDEKNPYSISSENKKIIEEIKKTLI